MLAASRTTTLTPYQGESANPMSNVIDANEPVT